MGNLQKLKLAREDKNVATDEAGRRRNKLLNKLREQLLIVRSDFGGEPYKPKKRIWLTNEAGEKELVERDKKVRRWYWRNGDKWFFQLRYGAKVLDLGKGRNAVEVDTSRSKWPRWRCRGNCFGKS